MMFPWERYQLHCGDCLDILSTIGNVALVMTDPPYGMTDAGWDTMPDVVEMWRALKTGREDATFILTASQPFTSFVVTGNISDFRCEWIWEKNAGSNFGTVKWYPMKEHESVLVFCKNTPFYDPIMEHRAPGTTIKNGQKRRYNSQPAAYAGFTGQTTGTLTEKRYPRSVQKFNRERGLHPTQKPVALMEYMVRTYTKPGDVVLDCYMGSGTTGVAALRAGRRFIGVERDSSYFEIARKRIEEVAK